MSLYLSLDGAPGAALASNAGWSAFVDWSETLADAPDLFHLVDYGWTGRVREAAAELARALAESPPRDGSVSATAANLLGLLRGSGAEVACVTNGQGGESQAGGQSQ